MTDIILENNTNDITFDGDDFALFEEGDNSIIAQRLEIKIRSLKGNWFRDINYGIPYFQEIFSEANNGALADTYIKQIIINDPDILSILSYTSELEEQTWKIVFSGKLSNGQTLEINLEV